MSNPTPAVKVSLTDLLAAQQNEPAPAPAPAPVAASADAPMVVASENTENAEKPGKVAKAAKTPKVKAVKPAKPDAESKPKPKPKPKPKGKASMDMERFGLTNEAQWLLTVPSRWEDYKTFTDDFASLYQGNVAMVRGRIITKKLYDDRGRETTDPRFGARLFAVIVNRQEQRLVVAAFGKPGFGWKGYEKGSDVVVRGVPRLNSHNEMELQQSEVVRPADLGKIFAVYPPIKGTKGERFAEKVHAHRHLMETAAQLLTIESGWGAPGVTDTLSEITQFNGANSLLQQLHYPTSVELAKKAQVAAKFLSAWTLIRKTSQRVTAVEANPKSMINFDMGVVEEIKKGIPFALTMDQENGIDGICRSLRSPLPMNGLLTGDVGSGKTLVFLVPMVAAHNAGKKVMLMTPNLLLIKQVSMDLEAFFKGVKVCKVTGAGVEGDPEQSIVIGTSALLGAMKKGKIGRKPDFLVVDEQHKFSVGQREELLDTHTNALEATATPIPRTAALATHGAKDLFLLHQIPVEKKITTRILGREKAKDARNAVLEAVINRGEQAAVIYPIVATEDPEKMLQSVAQAAGNWSRKVPMEQIAVLHGKMKDEEKNSVLDAFRRGEKRLLLSSTVIEVGVTLPELKTMLVIGADAFGVVTLHQLRGRLARHGGNGDFVMFSESMEPEAMERLGLLVAHQDGFLLAEKDAELRGYGDILGLEGDEQSGKTRTVFMGVNIGPQHLSFAANLHEKLHSIERANMATEVVNLTARKGESLRMA